MEDLHTKVSYGLLNDRCVIFQYIFFIGAIDCIAVIIAGPGVISTIQIQNQVLAENSGDQSSKKKSMHDS